MEEYRVTGVVLNSVDYSEKDKIITIFTLELGKLTAKLKGVKNPNAHLKFAGQPFCFGEWILQKKGENFLVTSCSLIDSFFELTSDYDKFEIASRMLKICSYILKPGMISEKLFLALIKCFKLMIYDGVNPVLLKIKFDLIALEINGFSFNYSNCNLCGKPFIKEIYLSCSNGLLCSGCSNNSQDKLISRQELNYLKLVNEASIEKIRTIKMADSILFELEIINKILMKNLLDFDEK